MTGYDEFGFYTYDEEIRGLGLLVRRSTITKAF
jgi:hypothetical protein